MNIQSSTVPVEEEEKKSILGPSEAHVVLWPQLQPCLAIDAGVHVQSQYAVPGCLETIGDAKGVSTSIMTDRLSRLCCIVSTDCAGPKCELR